jgi:hypothetical protein
VLEEEEATEAREQRRGQHTPAAFAARPRVRVSGSATPHKPKHKTTNTQPKQKREFWRGKLAKSSAKRRGEPRALSAPLQSQRRSSQVVNFKVRGHAGLSEL